MAPSIGGIDIYDNFAFVEVPAASASIIMARSTGRRPAGSSRRSASPGRTLTCSSAPKAEATDAAIKQTQMVAVPC